MDTGARRKGSSPACMTSELRELFTHSQRGVNKIVPMSLASSLRQRVDVSQLGMLISSGSARIVAGRQPSLQRLAIDKRQRATKIARDGPPPTTRKSTTASGLWMKMV
jgi:hypothetical protein